MIVRVEFKLARRILTLKNTPKIVTTLDENLIRFVSLVFSDLPNSGHIIWDSPYSDDNEVGRERLTTEQLTRRQRTSRSGRLVVGRLIIYIRFSPSHSLCVPPLPQPRLQPSTAHQHFRLPGLIFSHATFARARTH